MALMIPSFYGFGDFFVDAMLWIKAAVMGLVEGLTEFLPISSTAHMKFANPLIGIQKDPFVDLFEIVIQLAAIASVLVIYWKRFLDFKKLDFYYKLVIAVIPALVFGALLKKHIDDNTSNKILTDLISNYTVDIENYLKTYKK